MRASRRFATLLCLSALTACSSPATPVSPPHVQSAMPGRQSPSPPRVVAVATYPLTGRPVQNVDRARRTAISVKIDNIHAALPQAGLNQADLVTDILVEGGLTRLMATFQSHDAEEIGPIRSARPVDADLLRELGGGIFAYSGADPREIAPVRGHSTALLVSNDADPRWFRRERSRRAPHNLFSSTSRLLQAGRTLHHGAIAAPPKLFSYSNAVPSGPKAHAVRIPFSPLAVAGWVWTGLSYERLQDGRPDVLVNGDRVSTNNVVILSVAVRATTIIDGAGHADPYVIVIGSGRAKVLRDGRIVTGRWSRPSYAQPLQLRDAHGSRISLSPGRTWIELQPRPYVPMVTS